MRESSSGKEKIMGKLDGKVAAITGAGRGIGRALAKAMAAQGAAVVVNDLGVSVAGEKETKSPADDVVAEIRGGGGKAASNHQDIATMEGGKGLVEQAIKEFGKLDILVNIAGILRDRMIFSMSEEEWDLVIKVHLKGHFCPTHFASIHMRERKWGRIINFSSNAALGSPGQPNYGAAKAGILGLTYSCAHALAKYNITCNAIMPGAATRMTDTIPQGRVAGALITSDKAEGTPMDPANVAPAIIFLVSDEGASINGQCIGSSGYRVVQYAPLHADKVLVNDGPWEMDKLIKAFKSAFGTEMKAPPMFGGG
jgi:NAD(P)-dependent dehydrogenase (short-subunit alcohol dehydrogenase family)